MIKLTRGDAPAALDAAEVARLTAEFAATGKSVWNKQYLKEALLQLSSHKCAYCETNVAEESKYMEVEHFRSKNDFPERVVEWENLLPSCKRCNGQKLDHNVETEGMLVNPFECNPVDHFYFQNYRLRGRDEIGRRTVSTLWLNDTDRLVTVRMKMGELIADALENLREQTERYLADAKPDIGLRKRIVRGIAKLLREAGPSSEYSALAATCLLMDDNYAWIKERLLEKGLWTDLDQIEAEAASNALRL